MGVTMEYDYLAVFYALLATVAFVQLIRIQQRNSSVWTTQKSFVVLNFLVMSIRAVVFAIRGKLDEIEPNVIASILLDLPGLIFFTTCASFLLFSFGRGTNDFFLFFSLIEKRKRRNKNHHNRTRIKKTLQNKILT
jgi:hypothetical protein